MNLYELLIQDHEKAKALFMQLEKLGDSDAQKREEYFEELKVELTAHAEVEENLFYSMLRDEPESRDETLEAIEEHKVMRRLLHELDYNDKEQDSWKAKLKVLTVNTLHHIKEEEAELFKKARHILDEEEADEIADQIEAYKEGMLSTDPKK